MAAKLSRIAVPAIGAVAIVGLGALVLRLDANVGRLHQRLAQMERRLLALAKRSDAACSAATAVAARCSTPGARSAPGLAAPRRRVVMPPITRTRFSDLWAKTMGKRADEQCWKRLAPEGASAIRYRVVIRPDGTIASATALDTYVKQPLRDCVGKLLATMRLPESKSGATLTLQAHRPGAFASPPKPQARPGPPARDDKQ